MNGGKELALSPLHRQIVSHIAGNQSEGSACRTQKERFALTNNPLWLLSIRLLLAGSSSLAGGRNTNSPQTLIHFIVKESKQGGK
jgi:hypothetical protein